MPFVSFRAPASEHIGARRAVLCSLGLGAIVGGTLTLVGVAQNTQTPQHPFNPVLLEQANRVPDSNQQMLMRERNAQVRHFDAANAERHKELIQASQALETMAMSLKAEVDRPDDLSQNTIHKAETIEKLARIVKERMTLTVTQR